jgi:hypothetical protein
VDSRSARKRTAWKRADKRIDPLRLSICPSSLGIRYQVLGISAHSLSLRERVRVRESPLILTFSPEGRRNYRSSGIAASLKLLAISAVEFTSCLLRG